MGHWFYGIPFFMGGFGWVWMILGVILIVGLIILIFSRRGYLGCSTHHNHTYHYRDYEDPIEILKRMYARGEISEEEYEKRRKNLEK